jgi:hypothetical protein
VPGAIFVGNKFAPGTFITVRMSLTIGAFVASYVPAGQTVRVDPRFGKGNKWSESEQSKFICMNAPPGRVGSREIQTKESNFQWLKTIMKY